MSARILASYLLISTFGCGESPARHTNITDFRPYSDGRSWRANEVFSDQKLIALAEAIKQGNLPDIEQAVRSGADVNATGLDQVTPLGWALMTKQLPAYKRLLELGADPNRRWGGKMPWIYIVARDERNAEWLKLALQHGGDPNIDNGQTSIPDGKETPIFNALRSRNLDNLQALIDAKADLNNQRYDGKTPALFATSLTGWQEPVLRLLRAGADFQRRDRRGRSLAYHVILGVNDVDPAVAKLHDQLVDFLVEKGADFDAEVSQVEDATVRAKWSEYVRGRGHIRPRPAERGM